MAIVIREGIRYRFNFAFTGGSLDVALYERLSDGYRMYTVCDAIRDCEMEVDGEDACALDSAIDAVNAGTTTPEALEALLRGWMDAPE